MCCFQRHIWPSCGILQPRASCGSSSQAEPLIPAPLCAAQHYSLHFTLGKLRQREAKGLKSSHPESLQYSHVLNLPVGLSVYQVAALKPNSSSIARRLQDCTKTTASLHGQLRWVEREQALPCEAAFLSVQLHISPGMQKMVPPESLLMTESQALNASPLGAKQSCVPSLLSRNSAKVESYKPPACWHALSRRGEKTALSRPNQN